MHFYKADKVSAALFSVLLLLFGLFFAGAAFLRAAAPVTPVAEVVSGTGADAFVSEAASFLSFPEETPPPDEETRVFEEVAASCFVMTPDGYGAVREETREVTADFVSSDGLCAVTNKTLTSLSLDLDALLASFSPTEGAPTVVVFHTHTSEGYAPQDNGLYRLGDDGLTGASDKNGVVAVGEALCEELTRWGVKAVHLTEVFDSPSRSGAYTRSCEAVEEKVKSLGKVDLAIDLHRGVLQQSGGDRVKPTLLVSGKKTAQITLIGACDLSNDRLTDWRERLVPTLAVERALCSLSPQLALPVALENRVSPFTLPVPCLVAEIGTDVNTLPEAQRAAKLLGEAVAEVMNSE